LESRIWNLFINKGVNLRTIGDRLANFDNLEIGSVREFNTIFDDVKILGYNDFDLVVIGEITKNAFTRQLFINNVEIEHNFQRRSTNEETIIFNDGNTISDNDFWMCNFV
jgi:hypothetical protein